MLEVARELGADFGLYKSVEYTGAAVRQMTLAQRWTIATMGVEVGAKFALFECDDKVAEWLGTRVDRPYEAVTADPDATYETVCHFDVSSLEPMVAFPHDPWNVHPAREAQELGIPIDQAFRGSCTNARQEDLEVAARS